MNRIIAFLAGMLIAVSSAYAAKLTSEDPLGGAPASNDLIRMVDVSDTTQSAQGSTKSMTVANLFTSPTITTPVVKASASSPGTSLTAQMADGTAAVRLGEVFGSAGAIWFMSPTNSNYAITGGSNGAYTGINVASGGFIYFATGDSSRWELDATAFYPHANNTYDIGTTAKAARAVYTMTVVTMPVVVASLPTCDSGTEGARAYVTDSNATLAAGLGNTVAGSGSNKTPVYCDGSNWKIGG